MNNIKFSVVVPVYKTEKYIIRCIESLINQTYKNLEIILVDDGSPDNCPLICDEYAKKDERVKVIHKKNEGLGMARNTGIENATGDYICFFDSDDFVELNLFEICAKKMRQKNYDVIMFDYFISNKKKIKKSRVIHNDREYEGKIEIQELLKKMIYNKNNQERLHNCAWNKLYSMEVIKKINFRFVSERDYVSEDYYSNLIYFTEITYALVVPNQLYCYCYNENSLTHTFKMEKFEMLLFQYNKSIEFLKARNLDNYYYNEIGIQYFNGLLGAVKLLISCSDYKIKTKKQILKKIILNKEMKNIVKTINYNNEKISRKCILVLVKKEKIRLLFYLFLFKYYNKK